MTTLDLQINLFLFCMRPVIILSLLLPVSQTIALDHLVHSTLGVAVHFLLKYIPDIVWAARLLKLTPERGGKGLQLLVQSKIHYNLSWPSAYEDSQVLADPWTIWVWTWTHAVQTWIVQGSIVIPSLNPESGWVFLFFYQCSLSVYWLFWQHIPSVIIKEHNYLFKMNWFRILYCE